MTGITITSKLQTKDQLSNLPVAFKDETNTFTKNQILPSIQITDGAAAGRVLVSDSVGRGTWGSGSGVVFRKDTSSDNSIAGAIDDINTTFTLSFTPLDNSLILALNGLILEPEIHYTLTVATVVLSDAPSGGDSLAAYYAT